MPQTHNGRMKWTWRPRPQQRAQGRGLSTEQLRRQIRLSWFLAALSGVLAVVGSIGLDGPPRLILGAGWTLVTLTRVGSAAHAMGQMQERERHRVVYPDADPGEHFDRAAR